MSQLPLLGDLLLEKIRRGPAVVAGPGAILSPCGLYRYRLTRRWAEGAPLLFVMLTTGSQVDLSYNYRHSRRRCHGAGRRSGVMMTGRRTHGHTVGRKPTREYDAWVAMRARCENPGADRYPRYGGRGISVCEAWHYFETFLLNMGPCPPGHSIGAERVGPCPSCHDPRPGPCGCPREHHNYHAIGMQRLAQTSIFSADICSGALS